MTVSKRQICMNMLRCSVMCMAMLVLLSCDCKQKTEELSKLQKNETGNPLFCIRLNGKCGYIDRTGKIIIEPQFDECYNFSEGLARVYIGGDHRKWGYIDTSGRYAIPLQFAYADDFSEGLAGVGFSIPLKDTSAYFEKLKEKKAALQLAVFQCCDDSYVVAKEVNLILPCLSNWGYIDRKGKVVIEPQFCYANPFKEGRASVRLVDKGLRPGKSGFIDRTGNLVIESRFSRAWGFSEGLAAVRLYALGNSSEVLKEGKWAYIDTAGQILISPQFDDAHPFAEGLAAVRVGDTDEKYGKFGFIDKTGDMVIRPQYDFADSFSEGFAAVAIEGKFGFIDTTGRLVIKPTFRYAFAFSEGLAMVYIGDERTGYINKKGRIVIKLPRGQLGGSFENGLAAVGVGDFSGYIDRTGKYVWKLTK